MSTADRVSPLNDGAQARDNARASARQRGRNALTARTAIGGVIVLALIAGGTLGRQYWTIGRYIQSTDDAYVKADSTIIAPKVSGYIGSVLVDDNQSVKAGQPLARIDDRDLRAALGEADASVAAASASVANLNAQLAAQTSLISQADANVVAAKAGLELAHRNDARRSQMAKVGYGSEEQADEASTTAQERTAELARQQAASATARQQVEVLKTQRDLAQAQLARAQAARDLAALQFSYTTITAPIDGTVAARSLRVGQYVQAGTQLMALVPLARVYVVANFKETQLTHVRAGQPVRIKVDTFPKDDLQGRVDSLAPASGMEFSLLPPDNATGNFTKIVQRIPVKIALPADGALLGRLRAGMSVTVDVDTRTNPGEAVRSGR